jgi:hypothetical protein
VLVALGVPGVDVVDLLQVHRHRLVELMRGYTRLKEEVLDDVGAALVVDAEIFRLDSLIRWLDSAEARLRRRPAANAAKTARVPSGARRRLGARR